MTTDDRRDLFRTFIIAVGVIILGAAAIFIYVVQSGRPAYAHMAPSGWVYPSWCCSAARGVPGRMTGDCAPIPHEAVQIMETGFQITLKPGDHPLVTKVNVYFIAFDKVRQSQDNDYHVCLYPTEASLRCLFIPPFAT